MTCEELPAIGRTLADLAANESGGLLFVEVHEKIGEEETRDLVASFADTLADGLIEEARVVETQEQGDWLVCRVNPLEEEEEEEAPEEDPECEDPPDADDEEDPPVATPRLRTLDPAGYPPEMDVVGDLDDLDNEAVRAFVGPAAGAWCTFDLSPHNALGQALVALRVAAPEGRTFATSVAANVAFGQVFARVEVHTDTGVRSNHVGPLPALLSRVLADDALQGVPVPPALLRELVVNALVHRDWSERTRQTSVILRCSPASLDVISPGELRPSPRNPLLLHLVAKLGLATGKGRGLPAAREKLRALDLPPLRTVSSSGFFYVRLDLRGARQPVPGVRPSQRPPAPPSPAPRRRLGAPTPTPSPARPTAPPPRLPAPTASPPSAEKAGADRLSADARAEAILALLRTRSGPATTRELVAALGWTRSTTRAVLAALVAANKVRPVTEATRSRQQAYALSG